MPGETRLVAAHALRAPTRQQDSGDVVHLRAIVAAWAPRTCRAVPPVGTTWGSRTPPTAALRSHLSRARAASARSSRPPSGGDPGAVEELYRRHWRPGLPRGLSRHARRARGRGHRPGGVPAGDPRARPLRSRAPVRALAAPHRHQPRARLGARRTPCGGLPSAAREAVAPEARSDLSDDLAEAIGRLAPDQRAVVVLRYLLEHTPGEIAEMLDLPRGTVNSRLRRALDELAGEVGDVNARRAAADARASRGSRHPARSRPASADAASCSRPSPSARPCAGGALRAPADRAGRCWPRCSPRAPSPSPATCAPSSSPRAGARAVRAVQVADGVVLALGRGVASTVDARGRVRALGPARDGDLSPHGAQRRARLGLGARRRAASPTARCAGACRRPDPSRLPRWSLERTVPPVLPRRVPRAAGALFVVGGDGRGAHLVARARARRRARLAPGGRRARARVRRPRRRSASWLPTAGSATWRVRERQRAARAQLARRRPRARRARRHRRHALRAPAGTRLQRAAPHGGTRARRRLRARRQPARRAAARCRAAASACSCAERAGRSAPSASLTLTAVGDLRLSPDGQQRADREPRRRRMDRDPPARRPPAAPARRRRAAARGLRAARARLGRLTPSARRRAGGSDAGGRLGARRRAHALPQLLARERRLAPAASPRRRAGRRAASAGGGARRSGRPRRWRRSSVANDQNSTVRSAKPKSARRLPCACARSRICSNSRRISSRALLDAPRARRRAQEHVLEHAVAGLDLEHPLEEAHEREPAVGLGRRPPRRPRRTRRCAARRPPRRARRASRSAGRACRSPTPGAPGDLLERGLDAALREHLASRRHEQLVVAARVAPLPCPARRRCRVMRHRIHDTGGYPPVFC